MFLQNRADPLEVHWYIELCLGARVSPVSTMDALWTYFHPISSYFYLFLRTAQGASRVTLLCAAVSPKPAFRCRDTQTSDLAFRHTFQAPDVPRPQIDSMSRWPEANVSIRCVLQPAKKVSSHLHQRNHWSEIKCSPYNIFIHLAAWLKQIFGILMTRSVVWSMSHSYMKSVEPRAPISHPLMTPPPQV